MPAQTVKAPSPASAAGYSQRVARWVVAAAVTSLLASFYLLLRPGELSRVDSVGADTYSRSALGHSGLLQLLGELGEPVLQLRQPRALGECGLLVIAEPGEVDDAALRRLSDAVDEAPVTLFVLPKRQGKRDRNNPRWIESDELIDPDDCGDVLRRLLAEIAEVSVAAPTITRVNAASNWRSPGLRQGPAPTLAAPQLFESRRFLDGSDLDSWIECGEGVLLGRIGTLFVLSDPDLIANHGLHRGDNAELVIEIVRAIKTPGAIVFDETSHGHRLAPSIWTEAGRFPLVLVPVHLLLVLALVLWTAAGRFGSPRVAAPPIGAGKRFLIENIINLLQRGGRHAPSLRRYLRQRVRLAAERQHAPRGLGDEPCRDWLLSRMPAGAARSELIELLQRPPEDMSPAEALQVARRVYEITEEKLHVVS